MFARKFLECKKNTEDRFVVDELGCDMIEFGSSAPTTSSVSSNGEFDEFNIDYLND